MKALLYAVVTHPWISTNCEILACLQIEAILLKWVVIFSKIIIIIIQYIIIMMVSNRLGFVINASLAEHE